MMDRLPNNDKICVPKNLQFTNPTQLQVRFPDETSLKIVMPFFSSPCLTVLLVFENLGTEHEGPQGYQKITAR